MPLTPKSIKCIKPACLHPCLFLYSEKGPKPSDCGHKGTGTGACDAVSKPKHKKRSSNSHGHGHSKCHVSSQPVPSCAPLMQNRICPFVLPPSVQPSPRRFTWNLIGFRGSNHVGSRLISFIAKPSPSLFGTHSIQAESRKPKTPR